MEEGKKVKLYSDKLSAFEIVKMCAILIACVVIVRAAYGMTKNAMTASKSKAEYSQKLQSLDDQKTFLEKTLSQINTKEGKESYIRKELRVVKPGEHMFVVQ